MPSITLNIRLALLTFILLCVAALLGFAQQFIANAAELPPSSALLDPTAQVGFDPAAAQMTGDRFSADGVDIANVDTLNVDSNAPAGPTGPAGAPVDSTSIAAAAALTETLAQAATAALAGHAYPDPGWPRTTAETALAAPAANPPTSEKWIEINLTTETVTAYSGTVPIKTVLTSTGTRTHSTVVGTFHVWAKMPSQTMRGGSWRHHDRYSLPGVPNILFFYQGYSRHGTYWHRNFGHPMSHGCAYLTLDDAAWFDNWTPLVTTVRTHFG